MEKFLRIYKPERVSSGDKLSIQLKNGLSRHSDESRRKSTMIRFQAPWWTFWRLSVSGAEAIVVPGLIFLLGHEAVSQLFNCCGSLSAVIRFELGGLCRSGNRSLMWRGLFYRPCAGKRGTRSRGLDFQESFGHCTSHSQISQLCETIILKPFFRASYYGVLLVRSSRIGRKYHIGRGRKNQ